MSDYEQFLNDVDLLSACTLGECNLEGKYIIAPNIVKDLIESKKMITSYKNGKMTAQTQIGAYFFNYTIEINESKSEGLKFASMYLIETYKFLGEKREVSTFLVSYSDYDNVNFLDKLKQAFNLYTRDEFEGKDIVNYYPNIISIKKRKKEVSDKILSKMFDFNKQYIIDLLDKFKSMGEYGEYIQKLLKKQLSSMKLDKKDPLYWYKIKQVIDGIIIESKTKYPEQSKTLLEDLNKKYGQEYKQTKKQAEKKEEPKVEKKKKKDKDKPKDYGGELKNSREYTYKLPELKNIVINYDNVYLGDEKKSKEKNEKVNVEKEKINTNPNESKENNNKENILLENMVVNNPIGKERPVQVKNKDIPVSQYSEISNSAPIFNRNENELFF